MRYQKTKQYRKRLGDKTRGSVLVLVMVLLFVLGVLLAQMAKQAVLDARLARDFAKMMLR